MAILIILSGIIILILSGFFFGRVLAVGPGQRGLEDKEQTDWLREHQEQKIREKGL